MPDLFGRHGVRMQVPPSVSAPPDLWVLNMRYADAIADLESRKARYAALFNESDHPRDESGEFSAAGSKSKKRVPKHTREALDAVANHYKIDRKTLEDRVLEISKGKFGVSAIEQAADELSKPQTAAATANIAHEVGRTMRATVGGAKFSPGQASHESHKVMIADLYDAATPRLGNMTLDQFKARLLEAHRQGHAELSRLDMVQSVADTASGKAHERLLRSQIQPIAGRDATFNQINVNRPESYPEVNSDELPGVFPTLKKMGGSGLHAMRDVRAQVPHLSKSEFDRKVLMLARNGSVHLHRHDYVAPMSAEELKQLVHDPNGQSGGTGDHPKGAYYVGMTVAKHPDKSQFAERFLAIHYAMTDEKKPVHFKEWKGKSPSRNAAGHWVTLSNGTHVKLDGNGKIVGGPKKLTGENVANLPHSRPLPNWKEHRQTQQAARGESQELPIPKGGFRTEKGSTYEVNGESTRRHKAGDIENPEDNGPQPASDKTIFVDPEHSRHVLDHINKGKKSGHQTAIKPNAAKTHAVFSGPHGEIQVPYQKNAEHGKVPVEFWKTGGIHVGHKITEMHGDAEPSLTTYHHPHSPDSDERHLSVEMFKAHSELAEAHKNKSAEAEKLKSDLEEFRKKHEAVTSELRSHKAAADKKGKRRAASDVSNITNSTEPFMPSARPCTSTNPSIRAANPKTPVNSSRDTRIPHVQDSSQSIASASDRRNRKDQESQ